jgi:dTDP-4-dehydrorhamnose reductase
VHTAYAHDRASIVTATKHVAEVAVAVGADIVFISTDAVFSGDGVGRAEDAQPDPVFDYGHWKAHAELTVTEHSPNSAIVRLPLVASLDPEDHVVARIRSNAARGDVTRWFVDEMRQPANAGELADAIWRIAALAPAERAGAWHLPGPESLSRYEIAQRVAAALGFGEDAIVGERTPVGLARPRHIDLRSDRARRIIGWSPSRILV